MGIRGSSVLRHLSHYRTLVSAGKCYFYVTDGWSVSPIFIPDGDLIISKTYMTPVEGENTRLRHSANPTTSPESL